MDQVKRLIMRYLKLEICAVEEVLWHKEPGDQRFNYITVIMRDRADPNDPAKRYVREDLPVLQSFLGGHCGGYDWNPRKGDLVYVWFYQGRKGIVLGNVRGWAEYPVCRPSPYDIADKNGQWQAPKQHPQRLDFLKQPYPQLKKPYCFRWFHGPVTGTTGPGRDWAWMFDYCQMGDGVPDCRNCKTIDSIARLKNQYLKVFSEETESRVAYPYRAEFHAYCGSYWMFESKDRPTTEYVSEIYTEGEGFWTVQGAKIENNLEALKGHLRHYPDGDMELHSATSDPSDNTGVREALAAPNSTKFDYAWEAIDFATGAYARILKTGELVLHSPTKITLDAPLVEETEDNQVTGTCTHTACTCLDDSLEGWT